jgi:hypothetical protein
MSSGLFTKSKIHRWALARAMTKQALKRYAYDHLAERRRWNFPTHERRRDGDR